jgi:hypothetical protein
MHMTKEGTREDIALLRSQKIYQRLKELEVALHNCGQDMSSTDQKHERILVAQECKQLDRDYHVALDELDVSVMSMRTASTGGTEKTYDMGYRDGLSLAEKKAAVHEGYIKGLTEGWEKAKRTPGPVGPTGPEGPRGRPGLDGETSLNSAPDVAKKSMHLQEGKLRSGIQHGDETNSAKIDMERNIVSAPKTAEVSANTTASVNALKSLLNAKLSLNVSEQMSASVVGEMKKSNGAAPATSSSSVPIGLPNPESVTTNSLVDDKNIDGRLDDEYIASSSSADMSDIQQPDEFNELDVVTTSDGDVCAQDGVICIPSSAGVGISSTFSNAQKAKASIVAAAKRQKLAQWNDALAQQIKDCYERNQTFKALLNAKTVKQSAFKDLEEAQNAKAASTLVKENAHLTLNNLLQLVSFYDQKRSLSTQQMQVCNQCPKMKEYQEAEKEAAMNFDKFKAQYELARMAASNADLGVTNSTILNNNAQLSASRGMDSVTSLAQKLAAAEQACDDRFPQEEHAKAEFRLADVAEKEAEANFKREKLEETNRLLQDRRSRSYYLSIRAGSHIDFGSAGYDAVATGATGSLTVSAWVKLSSLGHPMCIVSARGENSGQVYGWTFGVSQQNGFYFDATVEGWESPNFVSHTSLNSGIAIDLNVHVWYYVVLTWGEEQKLWVNGYNVARSSGGVLAYKSPRGPFADSEAQAGRRLTIGALAGGTDFLNGAIDDVAIWSREVPGEELKQRCNKAGTSLSMKASTKEGLIAFYDFGPQFDLGTEVCPALAVGTQANSGGVVLKGRIHRNASATWIPDMDSQVFCGKLDNTLGRKLIRRLSPRTADMQQLNDVQCHLPPCNTLCHDNLCQPVRGGGISLVLHRSLFGPRTGQIPKVGDGTRKRITTAQVMLSITSAGAQNANAVRDLQSVFVVQAFSMEENRTSRVVDSILNDTENTSISIGPREMQAGHIMVDITPQLRTLAEASDQNVTSRGIFITLGASSMPESIVKVYAPQFQDVQKRPQLLVGITDGGSSPLMFLKGVAPHACHEPMQICTEHELRMASGFDGYSKKQCGNVMMNHELSVQKIISRGETALCSEAEGTFCCTK